MHDFLPSNFTRLQPTLIKSQPWYHSFLLLPLALCESPYNGYSSTGSLTSLFRCLACISLDLPCMACLVCHLLLLVSSLAYSTTLNTEALSFSKTSGSTQTTKCYNPEDRTLHSHHHENLKCDRMILLFPYV
jgi:hypothetical protein